jgi:hypothetical protein
MHANVLFFAADTLHSAIRQLGFGLAAIVIITSPLDAHATISHYSVRHPPRFAQARA